MSHPLRFGAVRLELDDGQETWSWPALVGFSPAPIRYPLLGQTGCLEFMNGNFRGEDKVLLLDTVPSYLGTIT
jgi:hypothetical protein